MNERFASSNLFWRGLKIFETEDKHLADLKRYKFKYVYNWQNLIEHPAVYVLFGPRQIGKTTSIKQYISKCLLTGKIKAENCFYLSCDSLNDRDDLYTSLKDFVLNIDRKKISLVAVDEVTFIKQWERSIKALIDEGLFRNTILLLTGSDKILLEDASASFPGIDRRGKHGKDFVLTPLSFREYVDLITSGKFEANNNFIRELMTLFKNYLKCGGYLNAINFLATDDALPDSLLNVYESWIVSDFLRKNKEKRKLQDLLRVVVERLATQISYTGLAQESLALSTDGTIDYLTHLERLGVIRTLQAFDQNTFSAFPKKNKKLHFCDPLIAQVVLHWLRKDGKSKILKIPEETLVEGIVAEHYARQFPTYYIKAEGEVDLVYVKDAKFYPIEIKWSERIRSEELKQLAKYPNAKLLMKREESGVINQIKIENLVLHLYGMR